MKKEVEFNCSPEDMAKEFSGWGDLEQAKFFEHVYNVFSSWGAMERNMQILGIGRALKQYHPDAAQMVFELGLDTQ